MSSHLRISSASKKDGPSLSDGVIVSCYNPLFPRMFCYILLSNVMRCKFSGSKNYDIVIMHQEI